MLNDQNPNGLGTIILLNGPSASGKSSIQNEIQEQFDECYLRIGIDTFFDAMIQAPDLTNFQKTKHLEQLTKTKELIRSVTLTHDLEGKPLVPLTIGPAGDRIFFGMHHAIAAYASQGNNLIVDYILYKPSYLQHLVAALKDQRVYLIGLKAPLALIEEREKTRGTSPIGHARSHYETVHQGMIYDLELDVGELNPKESASQIKLFIDNHPHPMALKTLYAQF